MPSVRSLATDRSINPKTIQRAYGELVRKGFIYSVKGRGSFVGSIHKLRESARADLVKRLVSLAREARSLGMKREEFVEAAGGDMTRLRRTVLWQEPPGTAARTREV